MTVIRKRTGDKGGCCSPYSELQMEIERVDQTAIDAKTTANETEAYLNTINGKINEAIAVVPQVQTNTEAIATHDAELTDHDARIHTNTIVNDQQNTDIAALKTKTNDNTAAIESLEDEVGPETTAGTIKYRLKEIDTKLPTAIKEVEMIANASTVTHKATHISGTTENDALPVVSREQAGIMSASVYAAMEDVIANNTSRISVLEQSAPTYDISGLVGPNPTNAEISAAFTQKYPNVPIQAGLRAADYDNAHFWQYGKNTWIMLTQIDVQMATNQSLGIVKGSSNDGKIFVETDGSMSLKGYDALVSKDATHDSKINTLEVGLGNANARIDATNTNVANNAADIVAANGNISTNTNDISGLKGRMATAEGQIATHETKINQHTQSINGLSTDVNGLKTDVNKLKTDVSGLSTDVNGLKTDVNGLSTDVNDLKDRMTTAEGQIATHETKINQHTQSINGLTTDVNGLKTDVNGLKTDVNGLKTSKQDILTAGTNITIANNVISAESWVPKQRVIHGINDVVTEFSTFLSKAEVGDTFLAMQTFDGYSHEYSIQVIPAADYLLRIGNKDLLDRYFDFSPITPITLVTDSTILSKRTRVFSFFGNAYIKDNAGTDRQKRVGFFTITKRDGDSFYEMSWSYLGGGYQELAQEFYHSIPTEVQQGSGASIADVWAIVNYDPKS